MTTQTMNNFETLDLEALANVEGGNRCKDLIFGGALTGAVLDLQVVWQHLVLQHFQELL